MVKNNKLKNRVTSVQKKKRKDISCSFPGCNYSSTFPNSLKSHGLIHEKPERRFPFPCCVPGCDFRRRKKWEIQLHERQHESSRALLKCEFCPERFYPDKTSLAFHQRICHDLFYSKCALCGYDAPQKADFVYHIKISHKVRKNQHGASPPGMEKLPTIGSKIKNSAEMLFLTLNMGYIFQCDICESWAFSGDEAMRHAAVVHTSPAVLLQKICLNFF